MSSSSSRRKSGSRRPRRSPRWRAPSSPSRARPDTHNNDGNVGLGRDHMAAQREQAIRTLRFGRDGKAVQQHPLRRREPVPSGDGIDQQGNDLPGQRSLQPQHVPSAHALAGRFQRVNLRGARLPGQPHVGEMLREQSAQLERRTSGPRSDSEFRDWRRPCTRTRARAVDTDRPGLGRPPARNQCRRPAAPARRADPIHSRPRSQYRERCLAERTPLPCRRRCATPDTGCCATRREPVLLIPKARRDASC